jgi:hypothetical protein
LDIYNRINNATYVTKCNSAYDKKYIMALDEVEFLDVYRELKHRDTFLILDKKENINFFIKLNELTIIKNLIGSNKISISAEWNYYGLEITLRIDGFGRIPGFIMEVENNMDAFIIQRFLKSREAFVHYIMQDEKGIIKLLTEKIKLDENFIESLRYYLELDFYGKYPRVIEDEMYDENGYYIKVHGELKILEEVLDIVRGLKTLNTDGLIAVHVEANDFYKIIFSGDMINIEIAIDEISNSIQIIETGRTRVKGKPFFKYIKGLLYFYGE